MNFLSISVVLFVLSFSGCASKLVVLKPQCSSMNWFEKGRQDGMQGQPSNNWKITSNICDQMESKQIADYQDGWNLGLSLYCTKEHGFSVAKSGQPYKKICPQNYEEDFLKGFQDGLQVFLIEKETAQIIAQVASLETQLRNTKELTANEKQKLKQNIASLSQKKVSNLKILEKYNETLTR